MIVPKSWINQYVNTKGISDQMFAQEMTFAGNKVENVSTQGKETLFEFEITSNRPDTLSIIGIARETAAVFGLNLNIPPTPKLKTNLPPTKKLHIHEDHLCPTYSAIELENVKIGNSPQKLKKRLNAIGINAVNNIVDITNYIMHETGQPMHAFDSGNITGALTLRAAKPGETITLLDHLERTLAGGEIIIEDETKLIDLAGLMGGENSEITEKTTNVYLLVPIYDPIAIRRASKHLKLRTDASNRFEKNLDLTQTETVLARATQDLLTTAGGKQKTSPITKKAVLHTLTLTLDTERMNSLIGIQIKQAEVDHHLEKLGIKKNNHGYKIPSWRRDLEKDVDLIEEISRLHGYNQLPRTLPTGIIPTHQDALQPNWVRIVREQIAALGFIETYSSTLISQSQLESIGLNQDDHCKVLHPMSSEYEYMRMTTLENLIPLIKENLKYTQQCNLFELGTVFYKQSKADSLPNQPFELGAISTKYSYPEMKGIIENLTQSIGLTLSFQPASDEVVPYLHPSNQAEMYVDSIQVGTIGQLHPKLVQIDAPTTWVFKLNIDKLTQKATFSKQYPQLPEHPPIIEDLTFSVPSKTFLGFLLDEVSVSDKLIESVRIKEIFSPEQSIGKNITFTITYRHPKRSLKDKEIAPIRKKIAINMKKNFKADLVGKLE